MSKRIEDMSDDEIASLSAEQIAELTSTAAEAEENTDPANVDEVEEHVDPSLNAEDTQVTQPKAAAAEEGEDDEVDAAAEAAEATKTEPAKAEPVDATKGKAAPAKAEVDPAATPEVVNFEEQYKAVLAPFKANGREIQVNTVEEARQLMQMGANYNKKMQALKPQLAVLRMLDNAKLGEAELNFLIDVHNKVPDAINKLVKDSGIDPMDISTDKADGYKPGNHKPTDAEVELEAVLTDLDGSVGLEKTINVVTRVWDAKSKGEVARNPELLRIVNNHVESGIYDLVAAEIDRRKTFGQLAGLSDLEAYRQVGEEMNASGKIAAMLNTAPQHAQRTPAAPVVEAPNPKKADDDKRKEQKRGAAPAKAVVAPVVKDPDFNPLSMSDEEFAKFNLKS